MKKRKVFVLFERQTNFRYLMSLIKIVNCHLESSLSLENTEGKKKEKNVYRQYLIHEAIKEEISE